MSLDFRNPDYATVFRQRARRLARIRLAEDAEINALRAYYATHIADFITDWGCTIDPRLIERNLPAFIPFVLYPKQREWIDWVIERWRNQEPGLTEKSRDMGVSWLSVALACSLCLFHEGMAIGFGSRKEEYVDRGGSPKSLFYKARMFLKYLPAEFRGGWDANRDAPNMRINFPSTGSTITGEAGTNIGRGDRTSIYVVDEAAWVEKSEMVDAALSQTTNCRIDVSSAHGMSNTFAQKRHSGRINVFTFHWKDDPRKDEEWYQKQVYELDPVIVAQEIDINYSASVAGILIPSVWVQASIDAHVKLQFAPTGAKVAALDVADEGIDMNAFCGGHGPMIEHLEEWSGKGGDIYHTVLRAFALCDQGGYDILRYDADGLGAGAKSDSRVVNKERLGRGQKQLHLVPFRGSGEVVQKMGEDVRGRKNQDMFANSKAQAGWALRRRFQATHRAVTEGVVLAHDDLISIPSSLPLRAKLCMELSQPTYAVNPVGKIVIDKTPAGMRSPNLYDAVMIRFAKINSEMVITRAMAEA